jgi:hypothetical protein
MLPDTGRTTVELLRRAALVKTTTVVIMSVLKDMNSGEPSREQDLDQLPSLSLLVLYGLLTHGMVKHSLFK